jgi:hypothetical protein
MIHRLFYSNRLMGFYLLLKPVFLKSAVWFPGYSIFNPSLRKKFADDSIEMSCNPLQAKAF